MSVRHFVINLIMHLLFFFIEITFWSLTIFFLNPQCYIISLLSDEPLSDEPLTTHTSCHIFCISTPLLPSVYLYKCIIYMYKHLWFSAMSPLANRNRKVSIPDEEKKIFCATPSVNIPCVTFMFKLLNINLCHLTLQISCPYRKLFFSGVPLYNY